MRLILSLFAISAARAQQPPEERTISIGAAVTEALGTAAQGSVAFFKFEVPPELGAVFVQVSGCGLGADGQPAPTPAQGAEAADVKAFLSFTTPKPSVWEAQHRLSWCSDEPTLLDRAKGTMPQPANATSPTVLHISVYASAPSQFTLTVTRGMSRELVLGELNTYVIKCRYNPSDRLPREFFAGKLWSPFNDSRTDQQRFSTSSYTFARPCTSLSIQVPATSQAVVVRAQAQQLPSPSSQAVRADYRRNYGSDYTYRMLPLPLGAGLSLTAMNLTELPATWAMVLSGAARPYNGALSQPIAEHGELFISRSSPGFCRVEPCQLTIQLFAMVSPYSSAGQEPNATFSVTIGVFDASDDQAATSIFKPDVPLTTKTRSRQRSSCAPGCEPDFVADGVCHEACLTPECRDDGGDCALLPGNRYDYNNIIRPFCAPGCRHEFVSDGVCDDACFVSSCNWDGQDCTTAIRAQRYTYQELGEEGTNDGVADMAPPPPPLTP